MRGILLAIGLAVVASVAMADPPAPPMEATVTPLGTQDGLNDWITAFKPRARAAGISDDTLTRAFAGVSYDPAIIDKDLHQSEFTKTIWDYLDKAVSDLRISNGQEALRKHAALLDRIEARYGVEKEVVLAVWGLESSYGAFMGDTHLISALATLAYDGRRGTFFERELIAALTILQSGDITPDKMTSSWAGAMGHTQFMPSSYLATAVDFNADGRRDIWSDDPADALASTAAYLAKAGWKHGHLWGIEVRLPEGFDYDNSGDRVEKSVADWQALGVRLMDGGDLPDNGPANIRLPAGAKGAAFLTFANFRAIEAYNAADAYVIGIGHLADRLRGGPAIQHPWPREDRALQLEERVALQQLLTTAGFDSGGADGKIGPKTIAAIKAYQRSVGLLTDGYASLDVLTRLQKM
jgi:membrane-bound lytic murein transglycosylase B